MLYLKNIDIIRSDLIYLVITKKFNKKKNKPWCDNELEIQLRIKNSKLTSYFSKIRITNKTSRNKELNGVIEDRISYVKIFF